MDGCNILRHLIGEPLKVIANETAKYKVWCEILKFLQLRKKYVLSHPKKRKAQRKAKQMERLMTCPICLDRFRLPKTLPCMHTFCLTPCLSNLVDPKARSLRCPECHREHPIPPGGIQAFPSNSMMMGAPDAQQQQQPPVAAMTGMTTVTTTIDLPDRCSLCRQQKQTLIKCHDCSKFVCTDCRESHLREAFSNVSSSVNHVRRSLPKLSEKLSSYQQRVANVQANHEQSRREIISTVASLIDQLKHREMALLNEAESYAQSQLRNFRAQQETAEAEFVNATRFCQSVGTSYPNGQLVNESDIANIRSESDRYSQEIDHLQAQIPNAVPKLRLIFDNQATLLSSIQNLGRLSDSSSPRQPSQQRPRNSSAATPQTSTRYVTAPPDSRNDRYRYRENSRGGINSPVPGLSQTISYRPTSRNIDRTVGDLSQTLPARMIPSSRAGGAWESQPRRRSSSNVQSTSIFGGNPFSNGNNNHARGLSQPPGVGETEASAQRNYVTSITAARSLEGDDRPIFGGRGGGAAPGRGRGRLPFIAPIPEQEPLTNSLQRRGTFVLDEPSLPHLPQSGAQKLRDKVNVNDLYNVRRGKRAKTPVAFTIDLNERAASRATEIIDGVSG